MSDTNITKIPAPRVELVDTRTGLISREWFRFFNNIYVITGGASQGITQVENGGTGASGAVQALSGPGAVNITSLATAFTSTGTGNALTLADGAQGQLKTIIYVAEAAGGDTGVLTPTNLGSGTTITFNAVGDSATLQFAGTDWWVVGFRGAVVA